MKSREIRGVHVAWMAGGFCLALFALDGLFLAQAIVTFPGEVEPKSYLQGLDFNATLERRSAQRELGWTAQAGVERDRLRVRILDRTGAPVAGLVVSAEIHRFGKPDVHRLDLTASSAPGDYEAAWSAGDARRTEVHVEARRGETILLEAVRTLSAPGLGSER